MNRSAAPRILGFEHLASSWQQKWQCYGIRVMQGDFCVTNQEVVLTTVLGSCIAVCIYDPSMGYGGMNHFMLPKLTGDFDRDKPLRYGLFAMEQLINQLWKSGCKKHNLKLKVIGGGRMIDGFSDIGKLNIEFIEQYVKDEKLDLIASDLGGDYARKLAFFPATGRLLVNRIPSIDTQTEIITAAVNAKEQGKFVTQNTVELF
ncbi:MAG: hypothetical protein OFPII_16480 [Osedax symbiont Rs1]|nr:MAG: hypothetical protein OFPII_16480 [Osedax symbiont Rs1]